MPTLLTTRQEAFCRHYAVSGNAAAAARKSGYAETCARQQGYENLQKPHVLIRLDEIRQGFAETAVRESAILLSRLERIWRSADTDDNLFAMLQAVAMQAKLSGLTGDPETRVRLWGPDGQAGPLERAVEHAGDEAALAVAEAAAPRDPAREARRDASPAVVFEPDAEAPDADRPDAPAGLTVDEMARLGRWTNADGSEARLVTEDDERAAARFYGLADDEAGEEAIQERPDGTLQSGPHTLPSAASARPGSGPRVPPAGRNDGTNRQPDGTVHPPAPPARKAAGVPA